VISPEKIMENMDGGDASNVIPTNKSLQAEHYMIHEMLVLSLFDLMSKDIEERNEAIRWFQSEEEDYFFSFRNLAQVIGTTPEKIRKHFVIPAMLGDYTPIKKIHKFSKVVKKSLLYQT